MPRRDEEFEDSTPGFRRDVACCVHLCIMQKAHLQFPVGGLFLSLPEGKEEEGTALPLLHQCGIPIYFFFSPVFSTFSAFAFIPSSFCTSGSRSTLWSEL